MSLASLLASLQVWKGERRISIMPFWSVFVCFFYFLFFNDSSLQEKHPGTLPFLFKVASDSISVGDARTCCLRSVITMSMPSVPSPGSFWVFFFQFLSVLMLLKGRARSLCWNTMWATQPRGRSKNVTSLVEHINCTCALISFQAERTFSRGNKSHFCWFLLQT